MPRTQPLAENQNWQLNYVGTGGWAMRCCRVARALKIARATGNLVSRKKLLLATAKVPSCLDKRRQNAGANQFPSPRALPEVGFPEHWRCSVLQQCLFRASLAHSPWTSCMLSPLRVKSNARNESRNTYELWLANRRQPAIERKTQTYCGLDGDLPFFIRSALTVLKTLRQHSA